MTALNTVQFKGWTLRGEETMSRELKIFKVEAEGDEMYIQAADKEHARLRLFEFTGPIPENLLSWSEVDVLSEGQEFL